jgi:poly(3-hydroxybutyrate) depolymerase
MRAVAPILAFASLCLLPASGLAQDLSGFEARTLQGSKGLTLPYRLFKVKNPTAGTKYPLILFLHGAGERGDNNTSQLTANAGATVWATDAHQAEHPAYVIAPQCPAGKQWVDTDWTLGSYSTTTVPVSDQLTTALEIADAVATEFGTDPARQYITGLSMGGYGTWDAVVRNPTRFAAALPVCGAGDPSKADLIKLLPLWTFHGDADGTVPVKGSRDMVTALKAVGSTVQYSEYAGVGHDAWTMTYANEQVIDWLFENKKPSGAGGAGGAGGMGGAGGSGPGGSGGASGSGAGEATSAAGSSSEGTGGSAAGVSSGGSAASLGGGGMTSPAGASGSSNLVAEPNGDDASCSFRPQTARGQSSMSALLLGCAALMLSRRRRGDHSTTSRQGQ